MSTVGTNGYIVVKARRNHRNQTVGLQGARFVKNKPALEADEVAVQITLTLPTAAFDRNPIEVHIDVPETAIMRPEAVVTVEDAPRCEYIGPTESGYDRCILSADHGAKHETFNGDTWES